MDGNRQEAEDLTQEVFLAAYRSLAHFRQASSFSTWLLKIAIHKTLDHKKKKQLPVVSDEEALNKVAGAEDPLRAMIALEEKNMVQGLIQQLPADDQRVIVDYYYKELSYKEIARKEQVQVKTVESKLYRARKKLRKLWEKGGPTWSVL